MGVYKRGKSGVYYMDFVVCGKRIYKSTRKFKKKEAKQIEAAERLLLVQSMTTKKKADVENNSYDNEPSN